MRLHEVVKHPLSPFKRKTLCSILLVILILAIGTEVMHILEGWSHVDSFYFISLIATTQGPTLIPKTDVGKIFAAIITFVSVGAVISALVFIFGPLLGTVVSEGFDYIKKEERKLKREFEKDTRSRRRWSGSHSRILK